VFKFVGVGLHALTKKTEFFLRNLIFVVCLVGSKIVRLPQCLLMSVEFCENCSFIFQVLPICGVYGLILSRFCDCRQGLDWWIDLFTTYTHDSELHAITAPPLISTIHKSPQHPLSLFQPAMSSPAVPWQRLLTVEILQLHPLRFPLHSIPWRTA
jgi:hypothetical protein